MQLTIIYIIKIIRQFIPATFTKAFQVSLGCAETMCDSSTGLSQLSRSEQKKQRWCSCAAFRQGKPCTCVGSPSCSLTPTPLLPSLASAAA